MSLAWVIIRGMLDEKQLAYRAAMEDFRHLRRQAIVQQLLARLTGQEIDLLAYHEVVANLHPLATIGRGLQEIRLDAIVGSVGRYRDFTRTFLPRHDGEMGRWVNLKTAVAHLQALPPIQVYQIGGVYFVQDGHHRVSIMRYLGAETIAAYVTEVKTAVPLTPSDDPEQIESKARYAPLLPLASLRDPQEAAQNHLFNHILLALQDTRVGWQRVEQTIEVARRENGRILGLHALKTAAQRESARTQRLADTFQRLCQKAGVAHDLIFEVGPPGAAILRHTDTTDLVVVGLNHPPGLQPLARLSSGFNRLVQRCPVPLLALPGQPSPLDHALLAFDASPKAQEALLTATYLALRWGLRLTVVTVETEHTPATAVEYAREHLTQYGVSADCVLGREDIAGVVLETAVTRACNLIIMGGFGYRPVLQLMLGSTVDKILRQYTYPILICR